MVNSSKSRGFWNRLKTGIFCGLLAVGMVACDSGEDTGDFDSATLNQLTEVGTEVMGVNVEAMAAIYQAALASQGTEPAPKDDFQFACSDTGGGSGSGNFNFDGTVASWSFDLYLSNCNSVSGYMYVVGNTIPGQSLGLESNFIGQNTYSGCTIDFGDFDMSLGGITLADPPTASSISWNGFLNINCPGQDYLGCEFFDDPAATESQIRAAVIERCAFFDQEEF